MSAAYRQRVAVVLSHPIQHFCPQYSSWAKLPGIDLHVFFGSRHGLDAYRDDGFDRIVQWQNLALDFPHTFLPGAEGRAVNSHLDAPELDAALGRFAPDAVIVYGYAQALQRRAARWSTAHSVPVIMISDSELHRHVAWWKRAAKSVVLPWVFRPVSLFLTVGDSNEAYYRRYGVPDRKLVRCPFPIDVHHYDSVLVDREAARSRVRDLHSIPRHHTVLLMVGKLVPWKRQIDLVRLSNRYQRQRDDITVVLAGTGPDESSLRAQATHDGPGGVVFAGFVAPSELSDYYCAADMYVHGSDNEPHSLAISEAIYTGLPVVLSDHCGSYGPTDDVQLGRNGFVYHCGDLDELSQGVLALADNPDLRRAMAQESAAIARTSQTIAHGRGLHNAMQIVRRDRRIIASDGDLR